MFMAIRTIIGIATFGVIVRGTRKSKISQQLRYTISALGSILLVVALSFVMVENAFITFDSPQKAYSYVNFGKHDVKLVISGEQSDFVIGDKNDTHVYLIIPKVENGWKIATGASSKLIAQKTFDGISVNIYQYKNTDDCYVTVNRFDGERCQVADSYNSHFQFLEQKVAMSDKSSFTYYTHISGTNAQYWISINGIQIMPFA